MGVLHILENEKMIAAKIVFVGFLGAWGANHTAGAASMTMIPVATSAWCLYREAGKS